MGNSDGTGLVLLWICATMLGAPAILVLLTALAPKYVARAREVMLKRPVRSFFLGLVNFVFFSALVLLGSIEFAPAQVAGLLSLIVCLPVLAIVGLVAAAGVCGEKLWLQAASKPGTLLGSLVIGILLLALVLIVPFVGWTIVFGLILAGLGASIIALVTAVVERVRQARTPVDAVAVDDAA